MKKLFPKQYWLSWLGAALFFVAVFPYGLLGSSDEPWTYGAFCVILAGLSTVFYRSIVFRFWIRRLYPENHRYYVWPLLILSFCHLVFASRNPGSCICIVAAAALLLAMLLQRLRQKNV